MHVTSRAKFDAIYQTITSSNSFQRLVNNYLSDTSIKYPFVLIQLFHLLFISSITDKQFSLSMHPISLQILLALHMY